MQNVYGMDSNALRPSLTLSFMLLSSLLLFLSQKLFARIRMHKFCFMNINFGTMHFLNL